MSRAGAAAIDGGGSRRLNRTRIKATTATATTATAPIDQPATRRLLLGGAEALCVDPPHADGVEAGRGDSWLCNVGTCDGGGAGCGPLRVSGAV